MQPGFRADLRSVPVPPGWVSGNVVILVGILFVPLHVVSVDEGLDALLQVTWLLEEVQSV